MARILERAGIRFQYSKKFLTYIDKSGKVHYREVDFWLERPFSIFWADTPIQAIEVKGLILDDRCLRQREELRGVGVVTFIATPGHIIFWEKHGFLDKR